MPDWLPPVASTDGVWEEVVLRLYEVFENDFKKTRCLFQGKQVWWDQRVIAGNKYEEGFWHLISRIDNQTKERLLDPRRAERLPWCRPTLANSGDAEVTVWHFKESSGRVRTYVWLKDWDYVIILEKRPQRIGETAFIITAYHVDGDSTRKNLRRKYDLREP
jgi:hypothetical protein